MTLNTSAITSDDRDTLAIRLMMDLQNTRRKKKKARQVFTTRGEHLPAHNKTGVGTHLSPVFHKSFNVKGQIMTKF